MMMLNPTKARERLAPGEVVPVANVVKSAERLAACYTQLAKTENERGPKGYAHLDMERNQLIHVLVKCKEYELWPVVLQLSEAVDSYLSLQGHWLDRVTALELGLVAAQRIGDRRNQGIALRNLGVAYNIQGQIEEAIEHYQQAPRDCS